MNKRISKLDISDREPGIFLTGDVHHDSSSFQEQRYLRSSEISLACRYARIVSDCDSACTLFCTGITFEKSAAEIRELGQYDDIELGGHTYNCYQPRSIYRSWRKLTGRSNGPALLQSWDIKKTVSVAENITGRAMKSWRNHAYRCDEDTNEMLVKSGIQIVSNEVAPDACASVRSTGSGDILSLGVNVWPDHEHLIHGDLGKEQQGTRKFRNSKFDDKIFSARDWLYNVQKSIDEHLERGQHAVVLAHPGCMMVLDEMKTFRELCQIIKSYPNYKCHDLLEENEAGTLQS